MATIVEADIWPVVDTFALILIPANSTINSFGELVMGTGFAKQVRDRYPGISKYFGALVLQRLQVTGQDNPYHLIVHPEWRNGQKFGLFQSKVNWRNKAKLDVIGKAAEMLNAIALQHPTENIALPCPGIGSGGLPRDTIIPWLTGILWSENISIFVKEGNDAPRQVEVRKPANQSRLWKEH